MKRPILYAAILGFVVTILLSIWVMLFFSAKDTAWVEFFAGWLPRILCPVWILGDGSAFWFVAMPFFNAATYALIVYLWLQARKLLKA